MRSQSGRSPSAISLLVALGFGSVSVAHAEQAAIPITIPSGAVIGNIHIENENVFETDKPEEDNWFFRLANTLHIRTRKQVIADQLLFKPGDAYSERLLQESERILRNNRYLFDAKIQPVSSQEGTESADRSVVDIDVRTRDVWTFKPGISYGRQGGKNSSGFELQESNLLGFGKEVTVARHTNVDRTTSEYRYSDPHLFSSWSRLLASYSQNSDGQQRNFSLARPFYSLNTHWAAHASYLDSQRIDTRYDLGQVVDEFAHDELQYDVGGGWSSGLHDGWVKRFTMGYAYGRDRFAATAASVSSVPPENRRLSYPYIGFSLLQDDYEKRRNQDQIERTEDLYAGTFVRASVGLATPAFDSDRRAWLWALAAGTSFEAETRRHTLVLDASASGRIESGSVVNALGTGNATYYWRVTPRQLFFASLSGTASENLDAEKQVLLGGDSGLRGYPLRYQDGSASALLTLEHRIYTSWYLFRIFHVGGAVFFDAGRTFGRGNSQLSPPASSTIDPHQGLLKALGLGLRFGSSRSAFGNVVHVDLAFPLDGDPSIDRVQFIVETKQSF